jgi:transposase
MDRHTDSAFERLEIVETGRRRRWSEAAKQQIVLESLSGPRLITATARRHNISRSLLLIWRRVFLARSGDGVAGFVPAVVTPGAMMPAPAEPPASGPLAAPARVEIVLRGERRIIIQGALDADAVLKLARGLEALR